MHCKHLYILDCDPSIICNLAQHHTKREALIDHSLKVAIFLKKTRQEANKNSEQLLTNSKQSDVVIIFTNCIIGLTTIKCRYC